MKALCITLLTGSILTSAALTSTAAAEPATSMPVDIGAGARINALGAYDLGKELGTGALRNDLGPATLGFEIFAGIRPTNRLRIAGELGLAIGGLVKTDERYFGTQSSVGATLTTTAKASVGYSLGYTETLRYRAGMVAGLERLTEATGPGYVKLDTLTAGAWFEVGTQAGWSIQLRAEVHKPYSATIQGRVENESPSGHFSTVGVAGAYTFGLGAL